ncbi:MAG: MOSC domain-containing protein [Hyphomicrobiales bacterium]
MKLLSVNVGKAEPIAAKSGLSGINKHPQIGNVFVHKLGLDGDIICDLKNHGGLDQAVYLYGQPDYEWWSDELQTKLIPGTFGENLTIDGFQSAEIYVGDRFTINDLVLEVTFPRIPCVTLAARFADSHFPKRFLKANRPGAYCRVLKEGNVKTSDKVAYQMTNGEKRPILDLLDAFR